MMLQIDITSKAILPLPYDVTTFDVISICNISQTLRFSFYFIFIFNPHLHPNNNFSKNFP